MFSGISAVLFLIAFVMEIANFSLGPITALAVAFLGLFFLALGGVVPVVSRRMSRDG